METREQTLRQATATLTEARASLYTLRTRIEKCEREYETAIPLFKGTI